jgi:hypothetical protein
VTDPDAKSLLFLSCDIVGSTAFKQQSGIWQKTFLSFYREFPQILGELTREAEYTPGFKLWKPVGDELIFTSHVLTERDVFVATRLWLQAMRSYEETVLADVSLATKGGAFIATFPGPDSRSSIPHDPTTETSDKGVVELNDEALASGSAAYLFDFFGPSIDTGFRVLSACTRRHFTLSVEVAWTMAQCCADAGVGGAYPLSDLRLLDARQFKGVWRGREYPLFALDREADDLVNVALENIRHNRVGSQDVVNLCKVCAADPDWPSALYLPGSDHPELRAEPVDSLAQLRSNSMEGAETVPAEHPGAEPLRGDAPMG